MFNWLVSILKSVAPLAAKLRRNAPNPHQITSKDSQLWLLKTTAEIQQYLAKYDPEALLIKRFDDLDQALYHLTNAHYLFLKEREIERNA